MKTHFCSGTLARSLIALAIGCWICVCAPLNFYCSFVLKLDKDWIDGWLYKWVDAMRYLSSKKVVAVVVSKKKVLFFHPAGGKTNGPAKIESGYCMSYIESM